MILRLATAAATAALLSSCSGAPAPGSASAKMTAEIRRTAYGVPHIKANDYAGLGFGIGYASAEDNVCEIAERMFTVIGERAKYLGPGENNANVNSDLYHKRIIQSGELANLLSGPKGSPDTPSADARALVRGYAAGYSRYVRDTGAANITDPRCKGQPWVREIGENDYWTHVLAGQVLVQMNGVAGAAPPGIGNQASIADDPFIETTQLGSNAYGLGKEVTKSGQGMLLGNPHYPWDGQNRFYRIHLTIPGKLNVVGAGLVTNATVGIGHTDSIAWTHTVSTARRFGIYELKLDPNDTTKYIYEGKSEPMTKMDISVEVKDGAPVTHTFYTTRFGPVLETATFPWDKQRAFALRTIPQGVRSIDQYIVLWQAKSVRELNTALGKYQATGFNTTAADASGESYFGDMGMIPNVSKALGDSCAVSDIAKKQWADTRVPVLDGSRAACDWAIDKDATAPGVFGVSKTPHLFRSDYVSQSNDSHWLTNPKQPLTGFSPIFGDEATARSIRTQLGLDIIHDRVAGKDGLGAPKFDLASLQQALYQDRHLGAEMVRDDLVTACKLAKSEKLAPACSALEKWDLKVNLDSRGAHLFHMFAENGGLKFKVPFNAADPVHTPNTLDVADPKVMAALDKAVDTLNGLKIPLDARLGDVQRETRNGERIPIHGGAGPEGVFNVITVENLEPDLGWTSIRHGSSWIMTVEFTPQGPKSEGVLAYSQSTNPNSPFYLDQTKLYSKKGWDDLRFTEAAVEAGTVTRKAISE
ncbi:MAG: penicillin acylase family protein [Hyphomonadaceae bacterium]|nr:penicillin acylase family protein [Hyphomonadaceae bacterium]